MSSEKKEFENKNVENQGVESQNRESGNHKSGRPGRHYHKQNRQNRENREGEGNRPPRKGRNFEHRRNDNRGQESDVVNKPVQNQQMAAEGEASQMEEAVTFRTNGEEGARKGNGRNRDRGRRGEYNRSRDGERNSRPSRSRDGERGGKHLSNGDGENYTEPAAIVNIGGEVVAGFYSLDQVEAEKKAEEPEAVNEAPKEPAEHTEDTLVMTQEEKEPVQNQHDTQEVLLTELPQEKPQEEMIAAPAESVSENGTVDVIGVRFRQAGKIYYFDPSDFEIEERSHVIVETARGVEYGLVVLGRRSVPAEKVIQPLKPVIRVATPEDEDRNQQNREKEKNAFKICKEKIIKHGLDMKLIDCEYTFDNNKVLFYFTADGRIDFRELVKDLAAIFKTRIELRQIGVRDETKICGGIGMCGRPLCCHTYLSEFIPVSIKMAKDQNLSLNPVKISGICGRLMCCLKNEEETYEWLNSKLPNEGDTVTTPEGLKGEVQTVNVLRQLVKVVITTENDEKEVREYSVTDLKFKTRRKRGDDRIHDAELRALENLEKKENKSKL